MTHPSSEDMNSTPSPPQEPRRRLIHLRGMSAFLLYIFALGAALFYVLPLFVNAERYHPFLAAYLSEKLGSDVTFDSLEFTLADGPGVAASNVIIEINGKPALTVSRLKARLSFLRALQGQVLFDEFSVDNPMINVIRAKDGSFNIPFLNPSPDKKNAMAALVEKAMDAFMSVTITNANVRFKDERVSLQPVRISFFEANASFSRGILSTDHARLTATAMVTHKGVTGKAALNASLERVGGAGGINTEGKASLNGFGMAALWPYIKDTVPFERVEGFADLDMSFESDFAGKAGLKGQVSLASADIQLKGASDFKIRPKTLSLAFDLAGDADEAHIVSARAQMDDLSADLNGKVVGVSSSDPVMTITVDTEMLDINKVLAHIPDSVFTPQQVSFLDNNFRGGKAKLDGLTYEGSLSALRSISQTYALNNFSGGISVKDFSVIMPGMPLPFDSMEGSVILEGDTLRMDGLKARYGKSSLRGISGVLKQVHDWPVIDARFKADLDLAEAIHLFAETVASPEFRDKIEEVKITSGGARVDMSVLWDTKEPPSTVALKGEIAFNSVNLKSDALGLPIQE
ncbi:MAG: DUF748 domain-containing protein, partial [Nitrospinae bacterium]|nr:DUF748 domain-containing protein [Nitrospinota bacterium]